MPQYASYVPTDTSWTAVHAGHTEIAPEGYYVETEQDWSGLHTSYEDVYIPSEPEPEPLPDWKTMWAATHPDPSSRSLDDALVSSTGNLSEGGTLTFTLQRDESPRDQALPISTTEVQVNVLGTQVSTWQVFPAGSVTIDLSVPNLPAGLHTVEVQAFSNGRLVGTTSFTVSVAGKEPASPTEPKPEPEESPAYLREEDLPQDPPPMAVRQPGIQGFSGRQTADASAAGTGTDYRIRAGHSPVRQFAAMWAAEARAEPAEADPEVVAPALPTGGTYQAGQVMASGMGVNPGLPATAREAEQTASAAVPVVEAILGAALDGQGEGRRPPQPENESEPSEPGEGRPAQTRNEL